MTVPKSVRDALERAPVDTEPLPAEVEAQIEAQLACMRAGDDAPRIKWAKSVLARPLAQVLSRMRHQLTMTRIPVDPTSRERVYLARRIEGEVSDFARRMADAGDPRAAADIHKALDVVGVATELDTSTHSLTIGLVPWWDSRLRRER